MAVIRVARRSEVWADAVGRASDSEAAEDVFPAAVGDIAFMDLDSQPDPTDAGSVEFGRRLFYVLQDVSASMDDLAADAAQRARQSATARDPEGKVTVTLTGGVVTAVSTDTDWLETARHSEIGAAITAAVYAGYAAVEEQADSSLRRRWPFDELDRLTADPM